MANVQINIKRNNPELKGKEKFASAIAKLRAGQADRKADKKRARDDAREDEEAVQVTGLERRFAKLLAGASARKKAYLKIASLLANGIKLNQAIEEVWLRASNGGKKKSEPTAIMLGEWRDRILAGRDLAEAIAYWAPPQERVMISAGARTGKLHNVLEDVVTFQEAVAKMKGAIFGALAYPALLFAITIGMLQNFSSEVFPAFAQILPPSRWTGAAAVMAVVADWVNNWMTTSLVIFVVAVVASIVSMPIWTGRGRVFADNFPPWKIYRTLQGCSFMLSLAMMLRAGVQMPKALGQLSELSGPYLKSRIEGALRYINAGENLGRALELAGHNFPNKEMVGDLVTYSKLSNLDAFMNQVSRSLLEHSVTQIESQMKVLNYVCMGAIAGIVGLLISSMLGLQQQIAASVN